MFCENCACRPVLRVSYCVVQSCRVCVACSSCTVIFFVFFFMIMIREYHACFILHSYIFIQSLLVFCVVFFYLECFEDKHIDFLLESVF